MLGDLKGVFEMVEIFSQDMLSANIEAAEMEAKASLAQVTKLKKQQKAVAKIMAKYRASLAESEKRQEKWQREANKRMKKLPKMPPYPVGVTTAFAGERRAG
jgi:phage-related minor tail protein